MMKYQNIVLIFLASLLLIGATSFVKRNHVHRIFNKTDGRIRITVNTTGNLQWYPQVEHLEPGETKEINVYAWCTTGFDVAGLGGAVEDKKASRSFDTPQCASYLVTIIFNRTRLSPEKIIQIELEKIAEHT